MISLSRLKNLSSPPSHFPFFILISFCNPWPLEDRDLLYIFSFLYTGVQNFQFLQIIIIYKIIVFNSVLEQVAQNSYHSQRFLIKWDLMLVIFISRSYFLEFFLRGSYMSTTFIYIIFPHLSFSNPSCAPSNPQIYYLSFISIVTCIIVMCTYK